MQFVARSYNGISADEFPENDWLVRALPHLNAALFGEAGLTCYVDVSQGKTPAKIGDAILVRPLDREIGELNFYHGTEIRHVSPEGVQVETNRTDFYIFFRPEKKF